MLIDMDAACKLISGRGSFVILAHQKPDGDTLGSAFSLMWTLQGMGKTARVECSDGFPARYDFIFKGYKPDMSFEPDFVIAVDVASKSLLGELGESAYADRVDLCIDHHKSNTMYARHTLLDVEAPAVCQTIYELIGRLGATIGKDTATAVYLGISTDTGCFKYANTTAKCHKAAAELIDLGADHIKVNKLMFDTRSRGMLMIERLMIETITFYFNDKCAVAVLPSDVVEKFGVTEEDLDGIASFTARIEGVMAGVTVRAKADNTYRISIRTTSPVDASRICMMFGGGGHMNAAGCTMNGELYCTIDSLLHAVEEEFILHGVL